MGFIEITKDELVNIKEIDDQHKILASIVNKIYKSLGDSKSISILMNEFAAKSSEHFDTEDRLMTEYKDPNYISHKLEHDRMRRVVDELNSKVQSGTTTLGLVFVQNYKRWFTNHNRINDQKTAAYLVWQGVK